MKTLPSLQSRSGAFPWRFSCKAADVNFAVELIDIAERERLSRFPANLAIKLTV